MLRSLTLGLLFTLGLGSAAQAAPSRASSDAFRTNTFTSARKLSGTLEARYGRDWRQKMWPAPGHQGSGFKDTSRLRYYQGIMGIKPR